MKKGKRVLALTGVVLLLGMYAATIAAAVTATPAAHSLLMASLFTTVAVPIFIYAYMLVYRLLKEKGKQLQEEEEIEEPEEEVSEEDEEKIEPEEEAKQLEEEELDDQPDGDVEGGE